MKTNKILFILSILSVIICSCQHYTPKPRSYFRIELEPKVYANNITDNYSFEYPSNVSKIVDRKNEPGWFDIIYPKHNARIYCNFMPVNGNMRELSEDTHNFVYKHAIRADAISTSEWENDSTKVYGLLFDIKGNTASSVQFVLTDSTKHFLRGSLYFNNAPNKDSLAPVIEYIREDIVRIMETTTWK